MTSSPVQNRFKRLIQSGHPQYGLFCVSNALQTVEALAGSGFDFIMFDLEHSPQSMPHLHAQFAALATGHTAATVRVPILEPASFKQYLDLGAQALMVPNISNADEARAAVRYTRYPPAGGVRGLGGTMRATRYGRDKEYYARAAQETCLLAQIETREAMANLDAICRVEGVDMVFFGPTDLSADMGHMGQPNHPEVVEAIEQGIRRAVALGMPAGVLAGSPECERYVAAGATVVIVGSDLSLLVRTADALAAKHVQAVR